MPAVVEREQLPVEEAKLGQGAAWDTLFRRYQLPLYSYVFEVVREEQSALDIVQETFVSAARNIRDLLDNDKFGSWIFGIAHQKCIQRWRKRDREQAALAEFDDTVWGNDDEPDMMLIRKEQQVEFLRLFDRLPTAQRAVLALRFLEDFSVAEISDITGVSLGTVKSRLHYAKRALRSLWENQNEDTR